MKFELGDLVMIRNDSLLYETIETASNVGIVVKAGMLMYVHYSQNGEAMKFWAYDIVIDGRTYKNVPQEVLRGLKELEKDEED